MVKKPPPLRMAGNPAGSPAVGTLSPARWKITPLQDHDPVKVERALRERIKELNCLYGITQLAESDSGSLDEVLTSVVGLLPPAWQYPEITCARIEFRGKIYRSRGYRQTAWCQSSPVRFYGEPAGEVAVCYLDERPPCDEGPFLREERTLLDAVAERIGAIAMHLAAEQELQETNRQLMVERTALQETNTALRAVLSRIEEEKREIYKDIRANVEKVLMPILQELAIAVPRPQGKYIDLLRDNLEEITSPFVNRLSEKYRSMTPTEIRICHMIRSGLRTKEIARLRGISPATVSRHRERIRGKLGIVNDDVNLTTFLQMSMEPAP